MSKEYCVQKVSSTYVDFGDNFFLKWPKSTELTTTEDGFIIRTKFSDHHYSWEPKPVEEVLDV